jgi:hypothetical protein
MRGRPVKRRTIPVGGAVAALTAFTLLACNEHPVEPLDKVVTAVNRQENRLPAKKKIDFLFVIDNSGSMCEEQENLTENFTSFSNFLFVELGASADYRIAVTSTDLHPEDGDRGRFKREPAPPEPSLNCQDPVTGQPKAPDTEECVALLEAGELPLIIESGSDGNIGTNCSQAPDPQACAQQDLERKFRCLATLGTSGDGFEKGLEAIRLALSCDGPNAEHFQQCCRDGQYDPACEIAEGNQEPRFLRPDAILVVILVSDEDDCSDPASNPAKSNRAICKYGAVDGDGDGVPDGYRDREICGDRTPAECFQAECGNLDAETCRAQRCVISRAQNSTCEWFRSDLTPVQDYYRFLTGLKAQPLQQLVVATIVGRRAFTEQNFEITYNEGVNRPECDDSSVEFNPDLPLDQCCPQGRCIGPIEPSCESSNGVAFAGRRYLQLAELFGDENSIGCPAGVDQDDEEACVNICVDDFSTPLERIKEKVAQLVATYCLDKPPACILRGEGGDSPCETAAQRDDPANYNIRVRMQCLTPESQGGLCQEIIAPQVLSRDRWELIPGADGCTGGAAVKLKNPPPAGAEVFVEFQVQVSSGGGGNAAVEPDGAANAAPPANLDAAAPADQPDAAVGG